MKYKILQLDANGRISFTKEELEKLLDEVYDNGYEDGRKTCYYPYWTYPTKPYWDPNKIWITTDGTKPLPNDYCQVHKDNYEIHVGDDPNKMSSGTTTAAPNTDFAPHWTAERVVYGTTNTSTDKKYTG